MRNRHRAAARILLISLALSACRPAQLATPSPAEPTATVLAEIEPTPTYVPADTDRIAALQESSTDMLGFHKSSLAYGTVIDAGARVVNVRELGTFFVLWTPYGYTSQDERPVMLLVHESDDEAYSMMAARMGRADKHGYALVAVQWWLGEDRYLAPEVVCRLISTAIEYVGQTDGADIHNAAYEGFGQGAAIAYQIAYSDQVLGSDCFSLFICHSGGMHESGSPFVENLRAGSLGNDAFRGQHFYMYCGMKDEQWGTMMCEYMGNAEHTVTKYGGTVDRFIRDAHGSHGGFLKNDVYYEDAIATWFELAFP